MTTTMEQRLRARMDSGRCMADACRDLGIPAWKMDVTPCGWIRWASRSSVGKDGHVVEGGLRRREGHAQAMRILSNTNGNPRDRDAWCRQDAADAETLRRAAAHAHKMSNWADDQHTPEAHRAAADAHRRVADLHRGA